MQCDFCNRKIRCLQQFFGNLHSVFDQIIHWRLPNGFPETAQTFAGADRGGVRNLFQGQFLGIVFLDKGHHCQNAVLIFGCGAVCANIRFLNYTQKKQPDFTDQASCLKFDIRLRLKKGERPQFPQKFALCTGFSADTQYIDIFVLDHGG